MPTDDEIIAAQEAEKFLTEVMARHDWTIDDLAEHSGYALRTLKKAMKAGTGVTLSRKMREGIERASLLAFERADLAKMPRPSLEAPSTEEPSETPGMYRVRILSPSGPEETRLIPADPDLESIDHLIDMLRDYRTASIATRRVLLKEIKEMVGELEAKPTSFRQSEQSVLQSQRGGKGNVQEGGDLTQ